MMSRYSSPGPSGSSVRAPLPRISEFYGILIYMYFSDHAPPHFHAMYGRFEAEILIETGTTLKGRLPRRAAALVREWTHSYRAELEDNWRRARDHEALHRVPPLD